MLFTYMIRIVHPLNSISYMIIDEIITFITSSKLLLHLCDICFNYGLTFEAFSLLLISYGSLNPFQVVSCIHPLFNFLRRKIHMSHFGSMLRLLVIFHMNICITTHIVVNPFELYRKTYFTIGRAISTMKISSMFISMKVKSTLMIRYL